MPWRHHGGWLNEPLPQEIDELTHGLTEITTRVIHGMRLSVGTDSVTVLLGNGLAIYASPKKKSQ